MRLPDDDIDDDDDDDANDDEDDNDNVEFQTTKTTTAQKIDHSISGLRMKGTVLEAQHHLTGAIDDERRPGQKATSGAARFGGRRRVGRRIVASTQGRRTSTAAGPCRRQICGPPWRRRRTDDLLSDAADERPQLEVDAAAAGGRDVEETMAVAGTVMASVQVQFEPLRTW